MRRRKVGAMRSIPANDLNTALRMQVHRMLSRLRQTVPFPLDPVEVYKEAFNGLDEHVLISNDAITESVWQRNLITCLSYNKVIPFEVREFPLDPMEDDGLIRRFWVRFQRPMPQPIDGLDLCVGPKTFADDRLHEWIKEANRLEATITHSYEAFSNAIRDVKSPEEFAAGWPELVPHLPADLFDSPRTLSDRHLERAGKLLRERIKLAFLGTGGIDGFTEMFGSAMLLEARPTFVWVGRYQQISYLEDPHG